MFEGSGRRCHDPWSASALRAVPCCSCGLKRTADGSVLPLALPVSFAMLAGCKLKLSPPKGAPERESRRAKTRTALFVHATGCGRQADASVSFLTGGARAERDTFGCHITTNARCPKVSRPSIRLGEIESETMAREARVGDLVRRIESA